jgi:predicted small lipoprotein YifL
MKNVLKMTALVLCCVALVACSQKGPAEQALAAAQAAVDGVKADVSKFAADQGKALTASLAAAREAFDKGDYKTAIELAQAIPAKAKDAAAAAAAKKDELVKSWTAMSASVPPMIDQIKAKLESVAAMKKLPKDWDKAKLEAAQANLAGIQKATTDAYETYKAGNVAEAVAKGKAVQTKVTDAMAALGLTAAPAAAAPAAAAKK